jgi:hypothetical protein
VRERIGAAVAQVNKQMTKDRILSGCRLVFVVKP